LQNSQKWVVIDEIQKVPALLDSVHSLIEDKKIRFALSGSSARKLRRGHANLLGGRALRYELYGLTSVELGEDFNLTRLLNAGYIPDHYIHHDNRRLIESYVSDYLKEEIVAEALVKNLTPFSNFLNLAAIGDTDKVNFATIARECGVSSHTVKEYYEILVDTLLGFWLPSYTKRRGLEPGSSLYGKAFENWVAHELRGYNQYKDKFLDLYYWGLSQGTEVDFVINDMEYAIHAKSSTNITSDHLKGLRQIKIDNPKIKNRYLVSLEPKARKTDDGILILPYKHFIKKLWDGDLI
jgi:predicted AAA+ superfamily ATPase